jgi:hypothetical protein
MLREINIMKHRFALISAHLLGLIILLLFSATPGSSGITDGLVAYYPLEYSAADNSWHGNNGDLYGNPAFVQGKIESGLSFDGYDDFIRVANSYAIIPQQQISITGWLFLQRNGQSTYTIVEKDGYWSSWKGYSVRIKDGGFIFELFNPYRTLVSYPQGGVPESDWVHFAVTYDGSSMRFYFNGSLVSDQSATGLINQGAYDSLYIGGNYGHGELWSGRLDDIRIYDRALSSSDVIEVHKYGLSVGGPEGSISGSITPAFSGAVIETDAGSYATTLPNGYFYMDHLAGIFTMTVTAEGCDPISGSVTVVELQDTNVPVELNCSWTSSLLSPIGRSFPFSGGTGSIAITIPNGFSWMASSNADWITITGGSTGTGNGTVSYSVNASASGSPRTGTLTIAGQSFTVSQTDTIPPTITSVTVSSPINSLSIPVTIAANDNSSGTITYLVTASPVPPDSSAAGWTATNPFPYNAASEGTYQLYGWAKDGAGNVSLPAEPVRVTVDRTAPVTTANPVGGWFGTALNITLEANEPSTIYVTTNGTTPSESSGLYTMPIPISTTTKLKFFAKDLAGNVEPVKTVIYYQTFSMGDVNTDFDVDLKDAILALQVLSSIPPAQPVSDAATVTKEGKIGLPEVIFIMQKAAGLRK